MFILNEQIQIIVAKSADFVKGSHWIIILRTSIAVIMLNVVNERFHFSVFQVAESPGKYSRRYKNNTDGPYKCGFKEFDKCDTHGKECKSGAQIRQISALIGQNRLRGR